MLANGLDHANLCRFNSTQLIGQTQVRSVALPNTPLVPGYLPRRSKLVPNSEITRSQTSCSRVGMSGANSSRRPNLAGLASELDKLDFCKIGNHSNFTPHVSSILLGIFERTCAHRNRRQSLAANCREVLFASDPPPCHLAMLGGDVVCGQKYNNMPIGENLAEQLAGEIKRRDDKHRQRQIPQTDEHIGGVSLCSESRLGVKGDLSPRAWSCSADVQTRVRNHSRRVSRSTGFTRYSSKPACFAAIRSSGLA